LNAENRNAASLDVDDQADGSGQRVRLQGNWRSAYIHLVLRDFEKLLQKKSVPLLSCSDIEVLLSHFLPRRDVTVDEVVRQMEARHRARQASIDSAYRRQQRS
jgi:hypothetical protein